MMFARWFLFETKPGELLVALLERYAGLALVNADRLGAERSGYPAAEIEAR